MTQVLRDAMSKMIVSLFDTRDTADAARQDLLEHGFDHAHIRVVDANAKTSSTNAAHDAGIAGVIENMFSGLLPDRAEAVRYAKEVSRSRSLVAVGELDDSAADHAAVILARRAERQGSPEVAAPKGLVSGRESRVDVNRAASEIGLDAQLSGPRVYSLPNSPTGWGEASRGSVNLIGGHDNDPARPKGLVTDVGGLGTDTDRSRLSGKS